MKVTVAKEIKFSASHRLMNYDGDCSNLHGHNYRVIACVTEDSEVVEEKESQMVEDFKEIKESVGSWIKQYWDHSVIVNNEDKALIKFAKDQKFKVCGLEGDPTAENMCLTLLNFLPQLSSVTIYETDSSSASVRRL